MYRISPEKERLARDAAIQAYSVREISAVSGIAEMTAWRIWRQVRRERGTIYCACGRPTPHRGWCAPRMARSPNRIAYHIGQMRDISQLNIYVPSRPRYERPDILNERETEITLLVNRPNAVSLDAPMFDGLENGYTFFKSATLTPLEILMIKEESGERQNRLERIEEWNRWCERRNSAFYKTTQP